MKLKAVLALGLSVVSIVILLNVPVNAICTRNNDVGCTLDFSGNTAICACEISADSSSDWISATMELWKGNTMLNSWSSSGAESVSMNESENITRYNTYRLKIHYSVNGIAQSPVEISRYYG